MGRMIVTLPRWPTRCHIICQKLCSDPSTRRVAIMLRPVLCCSL